MKEGYCGVSQGSLGIYIIHREYITQVHMLLKLKSFCSISF